MMRQNAARRSPGFDPTGTHSDALAAEPIPSVPIARRYLALWFPFLSSDRLSNARGLVEADGGDADAPHVFVERRHGGSRISAVDPRAQALGLMPGMALAEARAIPDLAVHDAAPSADQDWIERIADMCERYTPIVALDDSDGVTLEITDCAPRFGGEDDLVADVEHRLAPWCAHLRHAIAGSPDGAQALARFQTMPAASEAAALRRLDVAALRLPDETLTALREAGVKTLGDISGQPSARIAECFGDDTVDMLARLFGDEESWIQPRRRLPAIALEHRFAEPVGAAAAIFEAIEHLVTEASVAMEACHKGGRCFTVRLFSSDGSVRDRSVETELPVRDPPTVLRLFRDRLDTRDAPLFGSGDVGVAFDLIHLVVPRTEPLAPTQLQLEGGSIGDLAMAAIVDRRVLRLGHRRTRRGAPPPEQGVLEIP